MAVSTMARFFIMQIIATNLCIWLLTVILEATEEISHHDYEGLYAYISFNSTKEFSFYIVTELAVKTYRTADPPSKKKEVISGCNSDAILAQGLI